MEIGCLSEDTDDVKLENWWNIAWLANSLIKSALTTFILSQYLCPNLLNYVTLTGPIELKFTLKWLFFPLVFYRFYTQNHGIRIFGLYSSVFLFRTHQWAKEIQKTGEVSSCKSLLKWDFFKSLFFPEKEMTFKCQGHLGEEHDCRCGMCRGRLLRSLLWWCTGIIFPSQSEVSGNYHTLDFE